MQPSQPLQTALEKLRAPFNPEELSWFAEHSGQEFVLIDGKNHVRVFATIRRDAIERRLDEAFGLCNWRFEFTYPPEANGSKERLIICTIIASGIERELRFTGSCNYVNGPGAAETTALQRAANNAGIGSYLWGEDKFAEVTPWGMYHVGKDIRWSPPAVTVARCEQKLKAYNEAVKDRDTAAKEKWEAAKKGTPPAGSGQAQGPSAPINSTPPRPSTTGTQQPQRSHDGANARPQPQGRTQQPTPAPEPKPTAKPAEKAPEAPPASASGDPQPGTPPASAKDSQRTDVPSDATGTQPTAATPAEESQPSSTERPSDQQQQTPPASETPAEAADKATRQEESPSPPPAAAKADETPSDAAEETSQESEQGQRIEATGADAPPTEPDEQGQSEESTTPPTEGTEDQATDRSAATEDTAQSSPPAGSKATPPPAPPKSARTGTPPHVPAPSPARMAQELIERIPADCHRTLRQALVANGLLKDMKSRLNTMKPSTIEKLWRSESFTAAIRTLRQLEVLVENNPERVAKLEATLVDNNLLKPGHSFWLLTAASLEVISAHMPRIEEVFA